jgi:Putative DNA-binding domain
VIPRTLEEWSIPVIENLLTQGYYEPEFFDFKEMLPHSNDTKGHDRLKKSCCAFANSGGGFLVFGIKDDKSLPVTERLVGIDASKPPNNEFPKNFGNYPANCSPNIVWDFKNPPLQLSSGNVIHVIHIPQSWNAPHCFGSPENGWKFGKRTNQGNDGMSYEEIRHMFLGYYEKRLKLQLLNAELENIKVISESLLNVPETSWLMQQIDVSLINLILTDTFVALREKPELIILLRNLKNAAQLFNSIVQIHMGIASTQRDIQNLVDHRNTQTRTLTQIVEYCTEAIHILIELTSGVN